MTTVRESSQDLLARMIALAVSYDNRGDVTMLNQTVSHIRGDLDLPKEYIEAALQRANLVRKPN